MVFDLNDLEESIYAYMDQLKLLLSQELWENILLDCSKNEAFALFLLHRSDDVNMSMIADYLNVPLNTATGIIARMEKKGIVRRVRSAADKRVVTIVLTESGHQQIDAMFNVSLEYMRKILTHLTPEEIAITQTVMDKVIDVVKEAPSIDTKPIKKVRKIIIE